PTATPTCPPVLRVVGPGSPGKAGSAHVPANSINKPSAAPKVPSNTKPAAGVPPSNFDNAPMDFILDDYIHETSVGFGSSTTESAALWLNRFTPPTGAYPLTLNNIYVDWPAQSTVT